MNQADLLSAEAGAPSRRHARSVAPEAKHQAAAHAGYVAEIDALRGLAFGAVLFLHCGLLPIGWMGVWLFFVISGFSITTSLIQSEARENSAATTLRNFYVRRSLRIWPLYFAFITVNCIVLMALGEWQLLAPLPYLATFTYNLWNIFSAAGPEQYGWESFWPLWTLSVEEQFYILFPVVFLFTGGRIRVAAVALFLLAAPLARFGFSLGAESAGWEPTLIAEGVYKFSLGHFDAFAAGALLALLRPVLSERVRWWRISTLATAALLVLYVAVYALVNLRADGGLSLKTFSGLVSGRLFGEGREVALYTVVWMCSACLIWGVLVRQPLLVGLLGWEKLQALGRISFGAYLFHVPAILLLEQVVPGFALPPAAEPYWLAMALLKLGAAFTVTVAAAYVSFTWFERPVMRLRSRFP
jgi:peptidoglycan/LPS O-acetylase OafA/YrhL